MAALIEALHSTRRIAGLTHGFYRYPATTSPDLVRELIVKLTTPDDIVLDPFMGGGTTVVEALATGRRSIGFDINSLAVFIARVKTTPLSSTDWLVLERWASHKSLFELKAHAAHDSRTDNLPSELRDALQSALRRATKLQTSAQRNAARCSLLRTSQWALESRDALPGKAALRERLPSVLETMKAGMDALVSEAREHAVLKNEVVPRRLLIRADSRDGKNIDRLNPYRGRVRLVVTSPPYPGVHVLYHRWQVRSRRETAAPYWIADRRDGYGPSYYTLGGRSRSGQNSYFSRLTETYSALRPLLHPKAVVAQIVAFTDAESQLPLFLAAMGSAGYTESDVFGAGEVELVRKVPNRRWYARGKDFDAGREFLLFHSPER